MMALRRNIASLANSTFFTRTSYFTPHKIIRPPPPLYHNQHRIHPLSTAAPEPPQRKRLDIAIVGLPNAGKSQLLNSLVGKKVAAVSRKRHTTRSGILAARTLNSTQLVFVDTPGFMHHESSGKEGVRKLAAEASSEMDEVDYVLLVVDGAKKMEVEVKRTYVMLMFMALRSRGRRESGKPVFKKANEEQSKFGIVINKVDLVSPKDKLLGIAGEIGSMADSCIRSLLQQKRSPSKVRLGDLVNHVVEKHSEEAGFDGIHDDDVELFASMVPEFHYTSAITEDDEGVDGVLGMLLDRATPTNDDWIVDVDEEGSSGSVMTPVEIVEEILREKIYRCLHKEVPHNVTQQNRLFRYSAPKSNQHNDEKQRNLHISQDLIVRTKSHQKLVLGSGGKTLERIRVTALTDLEGVFECKVDLELNVRLNKLQHDAPLESDNLGAMSRFAG